MPIQIKCPRCAKELRIPDRLAGKEGRCPSCNSVIAIPGGQEEEEETPRTATPKKVVPRDAIKPDKKRAVRDDEDDIEVADEVPEEDEEEREERKRSAKRRARVREEEEEEDEDEEDDRSTEQDSREQKRKERARWGLARTGMLLWAIAMGLYCASWAFRVFGFTFGCCLAMGGELGGNAGSSMVVVEVTHYIAIGLFLANLLLAMIGTGLTFPTPARHWARPMAIQSFCLGIAALILLSALFYVYGLGFGDTPRMALGLFLFLLMIESARTSCFAFYMRGVAKSLKNSELASRAVLQGILVPYLIAGLTLLNWLMLRSFDGVGVIVLIVQLINFLVLGVMAFFYFRVVRATREAMSEVA